MSRTVITVGAQPPVHRARAVLADGTTARLQDVEIAIRDRSSAADLVISTADHQHGWAWPLASLRCAADQADPEELVLFPANGQEAARLYVRDDETRRIIIARCPDLRRRPRVRGKARLGGLALGAIASVLAIIFLLVPKLADQLAERLPPSGEAALGDVTFEQVRTLLADRGKPAVKVCQGPEGLRALQDLLDGLTARAELPYETVRLDVLDSKKINAFTLPGGRIVVLRGLLDEATQNEVAAVVAHELGHVARRDPTRSALRTTGSIGVLGLIFGDFSGGALAQFLLHSLIEAGFSQTAEADADTFAHGLLAEVGVPPSALGTLFERLRRKSGDPSPILAHFSSHPALGDRVAAARAADALMHGSPKTLVVPGRWAAVGKVCR